MRCVITRGATSRSYTSINPGFLLALSAHELSRVNDRSAVSVQGHVKIVLHGAHNGNNTRGVVMELHAGDVNPCLVEVPPDSGTGCDVWAAATRWF